MSILRSLPSFFSFPRLPQTLFFLHIPPSFVSSLFSEFSCLSLLPFSSCLLAVRFLRGFVQNLFFFFRKLARFASPWQRWQQPRWRSRRRSGTASLPHLKSFAPPSSVEAPFPDGQPTGAVEEIGRIRVLTVLPMVFLARSRSRVTTGRPEARRGAEGRT